MEDFRAAMFFLGLFAFVGFFYSYWQTMCIDWARQLMFEERAKLVHLVLQGELSFDSPQYRGVRRQIEKNIRFLHALTWPRLLLWSCLRQKYPESDRKMEQFIGLLKSIDDPATKKAVIKICGRVGFAAVVCLMGRSIILGPMFLCLYFLRILRDTTDAEPTRSIYSTVNRNALCFDDAQSQSKYLRHATRTVA